MDVFNIALSSFNAASATMNTSASNLANMDTPGYQARRANLVSGPVDGVAVSSITADPTAADPNTSNVDPAREIVNLNTASAQYNASAMLVRVGDQMMGSLLDMFDRDRSQNPSS